MADHPERACGRCEWRSPLTARPGGLCRINPPITLMRGGGDFETVFPWVSDDDWCGKFAPNATARRQEEADAAPF
jgi:hypothetical protein